MPSTSRLTTRLSTSLSTFGVVAALVVAALVSAPSSARADDATGTVSLTVTDQYGRPTPSSFELVDASGNIYAVDTPGTHPDPALNDVPVGTYGIEVSTYWSGETCIGVGNCASEKPVMTSPVITVTAGATTSYATRVTVPTITGGTKVGSKLTLHIPAGLHTLLDPLESMFGTPQTVTQQWMRGATKISGAVATTYTTTLADGRKVLSATLHYPADVQQLGAEGGFTIPAFTTNTITMAAGVKPTTTTKIKVAKRLRAGRPASAVVKVRSSAGTPTGRVTVRIGALRVHKTLDHGSVIVRIPRLPVGRYRLVAKYAGSAAYQASASKKRFVVRR